MHKEKLKIETITIGKEQMKGCCRTTNMIGTHEGYADKKLRYYRLRKELKEQETEVEMLHKNRTEHLLLKERVEEMKEKMELLNLVMEDNKKQMAEIKTRTAEVSNLNAMRRKELPIFHQRLEKMSKILEQYEAKIKDKREHLTRSEGQLKGVVRANIKQLTTNIFPISQVKPTPSSSEGEPGQRDTASAIAEASQTTYVRGRWVYTDTSHETRYKVVEPILSGPGDYAAHYLLSIPSVAVPSSEGEGEDSGSGGEGGATATESGAGGVERLGGAVSVCAGLTYLTQLVNTLAFYLDVTLPKKLCYSEFCRGELTEAQFARRVCRLNTNVLYLCLSQKVPPSVLRPTHTTPNVLALLDTQQADLGRQGSFEIAESLVESMEEGMEEEDQGGDGSDTEEEEDTDTLSAEWETVPNFTLPETTSGPPTHQAYSTFSSTAVYSQAVGQTGAAGTAGGIVSSAAASVISLFRGLSGATTHQK
ncbi:hypothetical protein Pcinc_010435 [Petrolisthes cinctipes]|uniref:Beclin 1-associated autophagy-related key regulator n=1 Tax=Petrolisthes cinctipes TaxID=88211 RepID=A0AAE1G4S2_PETCI|nr:hypothetical protein Pcinc_010435 [Petrolisthes cinctipes]